MLRTLRRPGGRGHPPAALAPPGRGGGPQRWSATEAAEIEVVGYAGLTVRSVARRAGVAPATAYNYFSSKDHLLAEVLWRRMHVPSNRPMIRTRGLLCANGVGSPPCGTWSCSPPRAPPWSTPAPSPCSAPLPDVKHLRDRIGGDIHRRLAAARGPGVDPRVVRVLEDLVLRGALAVRHGAHVLAGTSPSSWRMRRSCCSAGNHGAQTPMTTVSQPVSDSPYAYEAEGARCLPAHQTTKIIGEALAEGRCMTSVTS